MGSNQTPHTDRPWYFYVVLAALPFIIPFIISELYLRLDGELDTYAEKTGGFYRAEYNQEPDGLYWSHGKNNRFTVDQTDFHFEYNTNELGLREKKGLISNPDTGAFRVLALGDSFTEGFGASSDSTWPQFFLQRFNSTRTDSKGIEVYNAGMAGSDPFFNFQMLKDKLLVFKPNLVIQCVNTSDLADYLFRGGMERFKDGHVEFRKGPWWESLYRFSYTFRLIMHRLYDYNAMLVNNQDYPKLYAQGVHDYAELFSTNYKQLADSVGFSVVYIIQAMHADIKYQDGYYVYMQQLDSLLKQSNCISIDLLPLTEKTIGTDPLCHYSWKLDGHFNGRGYAVMGEIIADTLAKTNLLPSQNAESSH